MVYFDDFSIRSGVPVPLQIGMVAGSLVIEFQLKSKSVPREILDIEMEIILQVQLLTEGYQSRK